MSPIKGSTPTSKLRPSLPEDAITAGQKQGKAVTPVNPKNQIPSPPAPEHTQANQRDVKSVEQESADNNPIQKQSSPEAISRIQEILKEDGTLAQSYKKLVKRNSVQCSSDILEALLHDESVWKKKPDKTLESFIKKSNSLLNNVSSLKIAIDIADYGKVQLIPAGDQLKELKLSTDQLRELVEVSFQLAKGMLPLVELDQLDNQNSPNNIETLEQEVKANISELSEEHQQQVREKLKSVQNPTVHISIRGIDLWPDIQPALETKSQNLSSQNDQPEPPKGKTPEEAALIAARIEKFSKAGMGSGLKPEDIKTINQRKKLVNDEIAKRFQKKQAKLNEESETPRIPKPPKVPTPLKTTETEKALLPAKSPTAPAVSANSKQPVISQQKTEETQLLDLNGQQLQFFENEQLWQFFESSKQYGEIAAKFPQLSRNQAFNEAQAAKTSRQRNTLEKLPSLEELIQRRRTLKLKDLYFTEQLTTDDEELSDREVYRDDVEFFRAFYAYYILDEALIDNTGDYDSAKYLSIMLNSVNDEENTPEKIKTAITKGIEKFNILLKEEAPADSKLGKKVIQALNKHSNKTLAEVIFTHCFATPVFNHRNYDGLIKALGLPHPLNSHDLFDLKSLTDCIASQLMSDFDIPLSDGKSEGILIKDDRYMLRVAGDFFDAVDDDEE
ncbi:hypothetical protein [Endozoicomonas ascidiicola]|uniref:hypothetical protein n=1 Tax=Endozoicomonas ascidiicola TaxID=1698521 RepID=UPI00083427E7|nr:hypothetical protein [Endozoicomonas ascidiicola]